MADNRRLIDANALEFEPDENCIANGVLIWGSRTGGKTMTTVLTALKKMVANAPTVDAVEVVHGRWSPVTYGLGVTVTRWMCSNCKKYENVPERTAYCPNCGAKMDGERKDNG